MKDQFNNLKYHTANIVHNHTIPTALVLATAIGVGGASLVYSEHEYDSFSNKDTVMEVQDLNNQITELNTKYIEANQPDVTNEVREDLTKDIEHGLTLLEYDLLSSPISERAAEKIAMSFNGKEISDDYSLTDFDLFKGLNDLKKDINADDYSDGFASKISYVNDIKAGTSDYIDFETEPLGMSLIMTVLGVAFGIVPFVAMAIFIPEMSRPKILDEKPARRRKKKLSAAAKDNNRLA